MEKVKKIALLSLFTVINCMSCNCHYSEIGISVRLLVIGEII